MKKLIITIAQTGNTPTRERNPYAPLTPQEIATDVVACYERGAAITHIHARDENEQMSHRLIHYKQIFAELDKTGCPIIRQISTAGRSAADPRDRAESLALKPPSASLTTGSVNFSQFIHLNSPELIRFLAEEMHKNNVKPELEIFDTGMIQTALELYNDGLLKEPLQFNFVMGLKSGMLATPKNLLHCVSMLPPKSVWQVSVIGPAHVQLSTIAIALGGNVRVGVEDNLYYKKDVLATNIMLMDRITAIAKAYGRELATVEEAKEILGLE